LDVWTGRGSARAPGEEGIPWWGCTRPYVGASVSGHALLIAGPYAQRAAECAHGVRQPIPTARSCLRPAMTDREEWEHVTAISGAWPSSSTPDRAAARPAQTSTDQERSSLAAQKVGAAADSK